MLTVCPACLTRFRLHATDLKPRRGLVRCSQCRVVFDARDMMQAEAGDPAPEDFFLAAMGPAAFAPAAVSALSEVAPARPQSAVRSARPSSPWLLWAVPLLAVLLLAQIAWVLRPAPVAGNPFRVEFSALERWPGDALRLRVSFTNRAAAPQPWPAFRLKVEEAAGGRSVQQLIPAADYLQPGMAATMAAGSEHELRLLLAASVTPDRYEVTPVLP